MDTFTGSKEVINVYIFCVTLQFGVFTIRTKKRSLFGYSHPSPEFEVKMWPEREYDFRNLIWFLKSHQLIHESNLWLVIFVCITCTCMSFDSLKGFSHWRMNLLLLQRSTGQIWQVLVSGFWHRNNEILSVQFCLQLSYCGYW